MPELSPETGRLKPLINGQSQRIDRWHIMVIFLLKFDTKLYNINFRKMDESGTVQKIWYKISPKNTAPERVKALE